jgi:hypothetical protein
VTRTTTHLEPLRELLALRISRTLADQLRQLAAQQSVPASSVARELITEGLQRRCA